MWFSISIAAVLLTLLLSWNQHLWAAETPASISGTFSDQRDQNVQATNSALTQIFRWYGVVDANRSPVIWRELMLYSRIRECGRTQARSATKFSVPVIITSDGIG